MIPYGKQAISQDDIDAVIAVLRSDYLTTGPLVERFEQALAKKVGAAHAVVCSNGTAGLHLACMAAGLGQGDVAIVPAITFVATANAVRFCGSEVVFADVNPDTGLMECRHLEDALARAEIRFGKGCVKAVFPVHLNGQCARPDVLYQMARAHNLTIIEDACHALGGSYLGAEEDTVEEAGGKKQHYRLGACQHADMSVFSFHPVKPVTTGEGGAITTNDAGLAAKLRMFCSHGITRDPDAFLQEHYAFDKAGENDEEQQDFRAANPWYYEMQALGYNYRLTDLQCALGISQLARLETFTAQRKFLARSYDEHLAPLKDILRPVPETHKGLSGHHLYVVHIDFDSLGKSRKAVMDALRKAGIGTQVHYLPVPWQPYYLDLYGKEDFPGAATYYSTCLSLPLFVEMTMENVAFVVTELRTILGDTA